MPNQAWTTFCSPDRKFHPIKTKLNKIEVIDLGNRSFTITSILDSTLYMRIGKKIQIHLIKMKVTKEKS